jgi:hypothetical protein
MAQSNAERQRRYRQRLKAQAAEGSNAVRKLNEAYNAAAAEQRGEALARIRSRIAASKDENLIRALQDMIDALPPPTYDWTLEDWLGIAALLGKADEAATMAEAERQARRQFQARKPPKTPQRPWSPFRHVVVVPPKNNPKPPGRLYSPSRERLHDEARTASAAPATNTRELA